MESKENYLAVLKSGIWYFRATLLKWLNFVEGVFFPKLRKRPTHTTNGRRVIGFVRTFLNDEVKLEDKILNGFWEDDSRNYSTLLSKALLMEGIH